MARSSSRCRPIWSRITCRASTCRASMHRIASLFIVTTVVTVQVAAQDTASFQRHEAMVPMRDGVKLHTSWYVPRNATMPLPIIFARTPYGIEHADGAFDSYYQALVKEGYIFAFQDIRGRFGSEGTFVMQRKPDHRATHGSDESTDAYDTIEWMIHNIPNNNGRVGMLGISHGGWAGGPGRQLGNIDFATNTGEYFRDSVQAPFFAHYLKDKGPLNLPEALTFESGANAWVRNDAWPARAHVTRRKLYFRERRGLSFEAPPARRPAFDSYVSDPANPVPYRNRPVQPTYYAKGSGWYTWLLQDQRFVDHRPDVLSWETPPLEEDVVIRGAIAAHLFASTTGSDADWIVKLIDVYPEDYSNAGAPRVTGGYELMVANDVLRGRFRTGFERPAAIVPNRVREYTVDLHTQDYRFLKGHRIMVQVQSTWFPIIDRNPQTFVPNIFEAKAADFRTATQRIYRSGAQASYVELPIYQER